MLSFADISDFREKIVVRKNCILTTNGGSELKKLLWKQLIKLNFGRGEKKLAQYLWRFPSSWILNFEFLIFFIWHQKSPAIISWSENPKCNIKVNFSNLAVIIISCCLLCRGNHFIGAFFKLEATNSWIVAADLDAASLLCSVLFFALCLILFMLRMW